MVTDKEEEEKSNNDSQSEYFSACSSLKDINLKDNTLQTISMHSSIEYIKDITGKQPSFNEGLEPLISEERRHSSGLSCTPSSFKSHSFV